jgi:Tfp pilus assembly protein PilF
MPASHFIFIPAVLLIGIVIGWILGSRAAADAYAAQLRRSKPQVSGSGNQESGLGQERGTRKQA